MNTQVERTADELSGLLDQWGKVWRIPDLRRHIEVEWSQRLRASVGRCRPDRGKIVLNASYLREHAEEVVPTLCHEAAHVAAYLLHGPAIRPHGKEWAQLMRAAGFEPDRSCRIDLDAVTAQRKRKVRIYIHRCSECHYVHRDRSPVARWACPVCATDGRTVSLDVVAVQRPS